MRAVLQLIIWKYAPFLFAAGGKVAFFCALGLAVAGVVAGD